MATVQGKQLIYLYRLLKEQNTTAGTRIAYTTENTKSTERDIETTATKDGSVGTPGNVEITIDATSILATDDTMIAKLEQALIDGDIIEVWEADLTKAGTKANTYKGVYYQAYLSSLEKSSPADGFVEISLSLTVNGTGATGDVTVPQDQLDEALYVFTDTTAGGN